MPQDPVTAVPTLTKLTIERLAKLIERDQLPSSDYQFNAFLTKKLLDELRGRNSLNYGIMRRILTSKYIKVDTIDLKDIEFNKKDLTLCYMHDLVSFRIGLHKCRTDRKIFVNKVLDVALNKKSREQLKHLDLSGYKPLDLMWPTYVAEKLRALESLSFAHRPTAGRTLSRFKGYFTQLRCLDISDTQIRDIDWISHLCNLEVFVMHNLNIINGDINVLANLGKLRVLDLSRVTSSEAEETTDTHLNLIIGIYSKSVEAIKTATTGPWPDLMSLDISGIDFMQQSIVQTISFVETIVQAHPKLEEIGLLYTPLHSFSVPAPGRNLKVYNRASLDSLLCSLSHYAMLDRPAYVQRILANIYNRLDRKYTQFSPEQLKETFRVVCLSLQNYIQHVKIQCKGVECLFELCNEGRIEQLSSTEIERMAALCLSAIERHQPSVEQAEQNVTELLMLCVFLIFSTIWGEDLDRIKEIDFFRISKISLSSLFLVQDRQDLNLFVHISETLVFVTSKLSPSQKEELTQNGNHVEKLVTLMVNFESEFRNSVDENVQRAMTMILAILRNLMHEKFLKAGGVQAVIGILKTFKNIKVHNAAMMILNVSSSRYEPARKELCDARNISFMLSCLEGDFQETDPEKLYEIVKRSHNAASLFLTLLANADDYSRRNLEEREVGEKLISAIERYPELDDVICFIKQDEKLVLHQMLLGSQSNEAAMFHTWTALHLLMDVDETGFFELFPDSEFCLIIKELAEGRSNQIENLDRRVVHLARKVMEFVETKKYE